MSKAPEVRELELPSSRGPVTCAYHAADGAEAAVIMVGGGDGGLDGPDTVFPDVSEDLQANGVAALRVDFRIHQFPGDVEEAVYDVGVGLRFLEQEGVRRAGLVGHSFGGAVVVEAGVRDRVVKSVATLATQTAGAQRVAELAPASLLLIHGLADVRLTPDCSRMLHRMARHPKRLELLEGATHSLRQRHDDVRRLLREWFIETLG